MPAFFLQSLLSSCLFPSPTNSKPFCLAPFSFSDTLAFLWFLDLFSVFLHLLYCLVTQSCLTLCNPVDCIPPGSSLHGISQARILEWVAISSSRGPSRSRAQTQVSCIGRQILYQWATREAPIIKSSLYLPSCLRLHLPCAAFPDTFLHPRLSQVIHLRAVIESTDFHLIL